MQEVFEKIKERLKSKHIPYLGLDSSAPYGTEMVKLFDAIEIVNQVAEEYVPDINVVNNNGWIPCSERLPEEEYDTVLAVTDRNHYCVAVYTTEHGFRTMDIDCEGDFIAWQPLPEPYKGE